MNEPETLLQLVFDKHKGFGLRPSRPPRVIGFVPESQIEITAMRKICEAEHGFKSTPNYHAFSFGQRTGREALAFMRAKIQQVITQFGPADLLMSTDDWFDRKPAKSLKRFYALATEFGLYGVLVCDLPHQNN